MEIMLVFLGGVFVGIISGSIFMKKRMLHKTGYGYFSLEPVNDPDDPGMYTINMGLKDGQPLLDKKQIILKRFDSHK